VELKMVLYLPRDVASVPLSRQILDSCLLTLGVTPDTRGDIALALDEACANVIQHAGPGEEYEVQVGAGHGRCVIEVLNTGPADGHGHSPGDIPLPGEPVPVLAEHGRGLQIIDSVADNLQLTGDGRRGLTVHFEKALRWLPEAPGRPLLGPEG
jgi:serine/threonine-protein kinase RsbW